MKKKKKRSLGLPHFFAAALVLFLLAGISDVWINFQRTHAGYSISRLRKEILQIEEYNRKLKLEIAYLRSPENLENRAKGLGLRQPLPEQIIFLNYEGAR